VIKRKSAKVHQYGSGQKTAYFWFYPVTLLLLGFGAVMLRRKTEIVRRFPAAVP